jgi:hypothetical protein
MGNSRIDCKNIKKPNCPFYTEGRFCPNPCEGFISINPIVEKNELADVGIAIEKKIRK